jgi:hypothetical protein
MSPCFRDVRMEIRDRRNPEDSRIPDQGEVHSALHHKEIRKSHRDNAKGDDVRKDGASEAVRRAKKVKVMLTTKFATEAMD